jgi:hypothetical protein
MARQRKQRGPKYSAETFAALLSAVLHGRSSEEHDKRAREFLHSSAVEWVLSWIDGIATAARAQVNLVRAATDRKEKLSVARAALFGADPALKDDRDHLDVGIREAELRAAHAPAADVRTRILELVFGLGADIETVPSARDAAAIANLAELPMEKRAAALTAITTGNQTIERERTANNVRREWLARRVKR